METIKTIFSSLRHLVIRLVEVKDLPPDESRRRLIFNEIMLVFIILGAYAAIDASLWDYGTILWADLQRNTMMGGSLLAMLGSVFLALNHRGVNSAVLGGIFLMVVATAIAIIPPPDELNNSSSIFFFSIPIIFASMIIHPAASFLLAFYCAVLLYVVPGLLINWQFSDAHINNLAWLGFFAVAIFAWRSISLLEQALREQRTLNEDLVNLMLANTRLSERDRMKTKFVSDVSHELRSPMNALRLYLKTISKAPQRIDVKQILTMQEEVARLTDMIRDVLDVSRLEMQEDRPLPFQPVAVEKLVEQILETYRVTAEQKKLVIYAEYPPQTALVNGLPDQLKQIFLNLIANAIAYTPEGGRVTVTITLAPHQVIGVIHDTGVGIAPEDLPHLFTRFFRGARTTHIPGTGLGLAIVKEFVELHQGQIQVASPPDEGTTFIVTLPRLLETS
jgi:signal transduction histidine kinase